MKARSDPTGYTNNGTPIRLSAVTKENEVSYQGKHVKTAEEIEATVQARQQSLIGSEMEHRFGFHKATIEGPEATLPIHRDVRLLFREFAEKLEGLLPTGRAKAVAFTELESASMWAHKSIAETAPVVTE